MDALTFLKEKSRLTKGCSISCEECRISSVNNFKKIGCQNFIDTNPEMAVEIIEKWSKEIPAKTFLSDFKEKYPNAIMIKCSDKLAPRFCPSHLGYCP